jgi:hypothetical protein
MIDLPIKYDGAALERNLDQDGNPVDDISHSENLTTGVWKSPVFRDEYEIDYYSTIPSWEKHQTSIGCHQNNSKERF